MESDPLDALRSHPQPPADLESRVVTAVRASGSVRPRVSPQRMWRAAVAAAVIFVAGVGIGRTWVAGPPVESAVGRPRYLLLLAGAVTPSADGGSRSEEYGAWARSVSDAGAFVRGAELSPVVRVIGAAPETSVAHGLGSVSGYFIVEADTEADAVRLAETCPHVKYGGAIQVHKLL